MDVPELLEKENPPISIKRQCELLQISRSKAYYKPKPPHPKIIKELDAYLDVYSEDPCLGSRRIGERICETVGYKISRKRASTLRKILNLKTLYPHKDTSEPAPAHKKYAYLLKNMSIEKPDQVWTSDITYLPVGKGHFYLCCVMDWASREILGWSFANTMSSEFCLKALEQAFSTGRTPEVFNTDQGSQFTSEEWIGAIEQRGIQVSMDGRGRWQDNVRMERFWRTFKYEHYFLHGSETLKEIRQKGEAWIEYYNTKRPHSKLGMLAPSIWRKENEQPPLQGENFFQQACTPLRSVTAC